GASLDSGQGRRDIYDSACPGHVLPNANTRNILGTDKEVIVKPGRSAIMINIFSHPFQMKHCTRRNRWLAEPCVRWACDEKTPFGGRASLQSAFLRPLKPVGADDSAQHAQ